jgi:prepilin-type N-terminal cleavage/methylation domain-containing protein
MRQPSTTTRRASRGFSIIELLVSISLVVLLVGITYPFLSALTSGSRVQAGLNIVGMSSDVARQWVQAKSWANDGSTTSPTLEEYSGTAAIYCPTNEIRIVFNDRDAEANSGTPPFLEDRGTDINGYKDISEVDYIRIPDGVGIAGIERTGPNAADVRFIAPPFAIAFNELGQLSYGDDNGYIYYNGNGIDDYELGATRATVSGGYNPTEWTDSRDDNGNDPNGDPNYTSGLSLTLPFEAIECVPGIVVFSLDEFEDSGLSFDGGGEATLTSAEGQWLQENGEIIFFSPHTGVALRDEQE